MGRNRRLAAAAVLAAGATLLGGTWSAGAQLLGPSQGEPPPVTLFPPPPGSTPTTAPPSSTDTTAPADGSTSPPGEGGAGSTGPLAPVGVLEPPPPADGDGAVPPTGGLVPPNAQQAINSIARTAPNDNGALVAGAAALEAAGIGHDEAVGAVYGRFPVLGPTRWVDDWYYPRWTGATFRHHLGLDMMAPYGTPLVAPVDGIARISTNALGGLTIRVVRARRHLLVPGAPLGHRRRRRRRQRSDRRSGHRLRRRLRQRPRRCTAPPLRRPSAGWPAASRPSRSSTSGSPTAPPASPSSSPGSTSRRCRPRRWRPR